MAEPYSLPLNSQVDFARSGFVIDPDGPFDWLRTNSLSITVELSMQVQGCRAHAGSVITFQVRAARFNLPFVGRKSRAFPKKRGATPARMTRHHGLLEGEEAKRLALDSGHHLAATRGKRYQSLPSDSSYTSFSCRYAREAR
jgi:hypothetical protein